MSENADPQAAETTENSTPQGPRMRFPVIVVLLQLAVTYTVYALASTNMQIIIGMGLPPIIASLLLIIWWLRSAGVPTKERVIGLVGFFLAVVFVVVFHNPNGVFLLIIALPILTSVIVLKLLTSSWRPWQSRRWSIVLIMALWVIAFTMVRVDYVGGDLMPKISMRWTSPIEHQVEIADSQASRPPTDTILVPDNPIEGDWPEFRGPNRDSSAPGVTFDTDWANNPPKELWRRSVGLGWSSFTVVNGYLFTQEQRGDGEIVVCYRADTGDEVWTNHTSARFEEPMGSGPRATPTYAKGQLFTQGGTGVLQCLDAATGDQIWESDVQSDTNAPLPPWGFASSPLLASGNVIVFTGAANGKSVIAYDAASGEVAWTAGAGSHGYCSGQLATFDGTPQVLMISNYGIQSFDPNSGAMLWEHEWALEGFARIVQPLLVGDDSVLIGSGFGDGSRLLRISRSNGDWSVEERWTTKKYKPYFNDQILHNDHVYGYHGNSIACVDTETGDRMWKSKRMGGQVLLLPDMDVLLCLTEKGEIVLMDAAPDSYNEIARMKAIDGKTWNHPVIAHGQLFVRNSDEMACYELPGSH
jgi:outer membrane protein assembly factor BamB